MAGQTVCALSSVSKLYGRSAVLRNVSCTFEQGRCYLLLGENGAGKSTLLRVIAGLLTPTMGEVQVFDGPPRETRHRVGYMSHAPMLYDELSALENLRYFAGLYRDVETLDAAHALESVGLDPLLGRPVSQYSQGMRQRTSLARVLLSKPSLLLLDEPFSNMDARSAGQMLELVSAIRDAGRTVLLTTHQRELAEPAADVLLTMQNGALVSTERVEARR